MFACPILVVVFVAVVVFVLVVVVNNNTSVLKRCDKRFPSQHSSVWLTLTVVIAKRDSLHTPRVVSCF